MKLRSLSGAVTLLLAGLPALASAQTLKSFYTSYLNTPKAGACNTRFAIDGKEPSQGKHPVFVYLVGTGESYQAAPAQAVVEQMAARGFVAATVQYPNTSFGNCTKLDARAACVFDQGSVQSAVAKLCARARADCGLGVVVGGFSQGSILAMLSANHDARVRAAWGIGAGVQYGIYDLNACVADGNRALPSDRLRLANGEADEFLSYTPGGTRAQSEAVTGLSCGPDATSCITGNGSGWIVVQGAEVTDGIADHCYMRDGGCEASEDTLDPLWTTGTAPWAVDASLDWLHSFTGSP